MSGPKDFTVSFAARRLAEMRARAEAIRMARSIAVRSAMAREAAAGAEQVARARAERAVAVQAELDEQRQTAAAARTEAATVVDDGAIESAVAQVAGWRAALSADDAVRDFAGVDAAAWQARAEAAVADFAAGRGVLAQCHALAAEAEAIHDRAGTVQGQFATRNELLADVMASLKEIGFHVDDPFFERPDDPTGPVVLKATLGTEQVVAHVDLGDHVRTVWDGVEADHCRGTFFDYMDRMKSRGVDVTPDRADLRERPALLSKSANELPRSAAQGAG